MIFYQKWKAQVLNPNNEIIKGEFSALVPGNLQSDYARFIGLNDLMFSKNTEKLRVLENFDFEYSTILDYESAPDEKVYFVTEGIDYKYDILLDGVLLLSGEGMYTKHELDITDVVKPKSILTVKVYRHPKKTGSRVDSRDEAVDSCKPPMCYGWDWNPRLLVSGMWMPAYIETRAEDYIYYCEPFYKLNKELDTAEVEFKVECNADFIISVLDKDNNIVYQGTDTKFTINNVNLWWCNGQGEPNLYTWTVKTATCEKTGKIGFRTIKLVKNIGTETEPIGQPKSRYAAPITVELNGRRIFAKGSNYVNPELFPGEITKETLEKLVKLSVEANMNMLRVWGGAGPTKPEFYDLCDQYGILVWSEFPLACNEYTDDAHYLKLLEQEAISIIKALRQHPSIAFWCGGNELFNNWSGMDDQSKPLRLLGKLCYDYDFDRPYLATAPLEGMAHGGYLFRYDNGLDVFHIFQKTHFTAYSEFGVPCVAPVEQLKKIIPEDELFPITDTESWVHHHAFGAWGKPRWICLNVFKKYFGEPKSLEQFAEYSGILQEMGYKAIFEEARRQWPYCSMALNWCLNEPWITAANNSVLSYPFVKKQGYYGIRDALRPYIPTARIPKYDWTDGETFTAELWYLNDSQSTISDEVEVFIKIGDSVQSLIKWNVEAVNPNENKIGPSVNFVLPRNEDTEFIELILKSKNGVDNCYKLAYRVKKIAKPTYILNI